MKLCLDRIEGAFAVCLCEDDDAQSKRYDFSLEQNPALRGFSEGMLFEATPGEDGALNDIVAKVSETEQRLSAAKARLHALASRKKKNGDN
jgi:hypothetical protein